MKPPGWCGSVQKEEEAKGHPPCPSSTAGGFESLQEGSGPDPTPFLLERSEEFAPKGRERNPGPAAFCTPAECLVLGQLAVLTRDSSLPGSLEVVGMVTRRARERTREGGKRSASLQGSRCHPKLRGRRPTRWSRSRGGSDPHTIPRPRGRSRPQERGAAARPGERRVGPGPEAAFRPPFPARGSHLPTQPQTSAPAPAPAGPADACELGPLGPRPVCRGPARRGSAPGPPRPRLASSLRLRCGGSRTSDSLDSFQPDVSYQVATIRRSLWSLADFRVAVGRCWLRPLAVPELQVLVFCDRRRGDPIHVGALVIPKHAVTSGNSGTQA